MVSPTTGLAKVEEREIPLQRQFWKSQSGSCTCNWTKEACLRHPVVLRVPQDTWSEACAPAGGNVWFSCGEEQESLFYLKLNVLGRLFSLRRISENRY